MKLPVTLLIGFGSLLAGVACEKTREPPPMERAAPPPADASPAAQDTARPARLPDWALDPDDPAKDYVGRYLRATTRYHADTACVVLGKSSFKNGDYLVEVRNPADGSCGNPGDLRDTFIANVATDRMRIDDPAHHAPLKAWPDGSMPDAAPADVLSISDLKKWKTPVHDTIKEQQLYPLRIQLYGRGTYPVVTLAGWHALFDPKGDVSAIKPAARAFCTANNGSPMGFFAEMNRKLLLRIDCPDNPHWEDL